MGCIQVEGKEVKGIVSYYNKILGKTKYGILFITVLGILVSLLMTGSALITEALIDAAEKSAETGQMSRELISCIIAYGIFIVVVLSIEVVYSYVNSVIKNKTELSLRARILGAVLSRDYSAIQRYHSGDILNRATNDVSVVVTGLVQSLPEFIMTATRIVSAFVVLYRMNKYFALILLLVAPVTLFAASFYGKKVKKLHLKNQKCEGENRAFMTEAIQNMTVIKACDNVAPITGYFANLQSTSYKLRMKSAVMGIVAGIMMFLSVYMLYYIALMWGAYGMVNEVVGFGTLTAMLQLVVQFQAPFKNISSQINQLYRTAASASRIRQLEEIPDDLPSEYISDTDGFEGITIKDLTFSYTDVPVIDGLNAEIRAGEFVGIGGPSGTGKSTLLKLIMGLLSPTSGSIEIEGGIEDKRGLFSYVPQGNMVLSGSIKDNICFLNSSIPDEKVLEACELCCLKPLIDSLPDGINTVLGEKGTGLSEGQLQRIAIARAVVMDKKVLLLDEATSALDEATEETIVHNLTAQKGVTVVMVTHHTKIFTKCDKLIRLN